MQMKLVVVMYTSNVLDNDGLTSGGARNYGPPLLRKAIKPTWSTFPSTGNAQFRP